MGSQGDVSILDVLPDPPVVKEWQKLYDVILQETMSLVHERTMYLKILQIIRTNPKLPRRSVVYAWLAKVHAQSATSSVRRIRDETKGTVSLWRLLNEIAGNPTEITRLWCISQYASAAMQFRANRIFDWFAGKGDTHVRSVVIRRDQDFLKARVERIKDFVDEHVAHRALAATRPPTFAALDVGITGIQKLVSRYGLLLRQATQLGKFEPVIQENWKEIFRIPWIR
jgi:hypothetical protein